jgi:RNA 2',3'-cyclic 3'-phosphodiesterase
MIRLFVAVALPQSLQEALRHLQRDLARAILTEGPRWTRPDHIHLTLRFLGDVPEEALGPLTEELKRACAASGPFRLRLQGLGCFPNWRQPRILWVGLEGEIDRLERLQLAVAQGTLAWGKPEEKRPFHPHLTLARIRNPNAGLGKEMEPVLAGCKGIPPEGWDIMSVELMRSDLRSEGPVYTCLKSFPLGSAGDAPVNMK